MTRSVGANTWHGAKKTDPPRELIEFYAKHCSGGGVVLAAVGGEIAVFSNLPGAMAWAEAQDGACAFWPEVIDAPECYTIDSRDMH